MEKPGHTWALRDDISARRGVEGAPAVGASLWAPPSPFLGLGSFLSHHLSSFLSNFTRCCVTMVTMGQQFATENQGEKKQLWAVLALVISHIWILDSLLPVLWKGKLRTRSGVS